MRRVELLGFNPGSCSRVASRIVYRPRRSRPGRRGGAVDGPVRVAEDPDHAVASRRKSLGAWGGSGWIVRSLPVYATMFHGGPDSLHFPHVARKAVREDRSASASANQWCGLTHRAGPPSIGPLWDRWLSTAHAACSCDEVRVHPTYRTHYQVGNWQVYERALVRRGDVTLWLSPDARAA